MMRRRDFLNLSAAGAASLVLMPDALGVCSASRARVFHEYHDWKPTRVKHVLVASGVSGNMTLILGTSGKPAILIDSQTAPFGPQIRREAQHLGDHVELVISTHHHPEITGGLRAFTADTRVVSHVNGPKRIAAQMNRYISQVKEFLYVDDGKSAKKEAKDAIEADFRELHHRKAVLKPAEFTATQTINTPSTEMTIGGRRMVLLAPGGMRTEVPSTCGVLPVDAVAVNGIGAHTDNDLVVHLPDEDILIAGGLLSTQLHAVVDRDGGANTKGWRAALDQLDGLCTAKTIVIPGEGPVAARSVLRWQREYLETLRKHVETQVSQGRKRQEVRATKPALPAFPGGAAPQRAKESATRLMMSMDAIWDEI